MPSGSKKRKAAKKKKETEANSAPHSHQGGEDRKRHEENDSDGGETNSPLSQDHHHNIQQFAEVEDKSEEDTSAIQSAVIENESVEGVNGYGNSSNKVAVDEKSDIQIDREMKLKDGSEPNEVTFDYVEFETKSNSSSSSSSSDDESKFVDKKIVVINWGEPIEYAPSLRVEAAAVSDLRKTSDLPEVTQVNEVVLHNLAVVPPKDESYEVVSAEGPSGISVEPADLPKITPVTETFPVVVDHETIPLVEPVVLSKEEVHLDEDLGLKVDYKSESLGVSSSTIDTGLQSKVDIISTTATEDSEVISVAILQEDERKTLPQSSVPVVETVNSADHKKDTEIESLDKKTPVALTSRSMQATSCVGCCGLFELFTGSNR